ncbi:tail fiber domain-containing protein [Leclercia sp. H6W5]|uniref:tail fiber domain-containing protein n=1 Tax=Leclercia tamurae TaxID=2926467 RepID=UPI0021CFB897|nr:tail fiber domain-containing protein [Leclercia tamurae]MCU6683290.1 tail fiber domain-containing protein [Leclercia tamurae]
MTVSTEVSHNEYTGNGVTTTFPYTFRILNKSDLFVQTLDTNGNITTLVMDTTYTVTGAGSYSGGSIILPSPLASGWIITIDRELDVVQETDLRNQGKFFAETHENAFDYLTMLIQQCFGWTRLALLKPSFLARYYDAKQNKISNLADPAADQDAVNNRSMRSYVDAAVAGVVGGFGWFLQYGAGAVYRTFQSKMRDEFSVKDFGAVGDGVNDDTFSFQKAVNAGVGRRNYPAIYDSIPGGLFLTIKIPSGSYVLSSAISPAGKNIVWVLDPEVAINNVDYLCGRVVRDGFRTNGDTAGTLDGAVAAAFSLHRGKGKPPAVQGITSTSDLATVTERDAVTVYADIENPAPTVTAASATYNATQAFPSTPIDVSLLIPGMIVDTGDGYAGVLSSWSSGGTFITVQDGWYKGSTTPGIPSASGFVINAITKIWAFNANAVLTPAGYASRAAGFELGLRNSKFNPTNPADKDSYMWGFDVVAFGPYPGSVAYMQRPGVLRGFESSGAQKDGFVVTARGGIAPITAFATECNSFEQISLKPDGANSVFKVTNAGDIDIGAQAYSGNRTIRMRSSQLNNDYDVRLSAVGGAATPGQGVYRIVAASVEFDGNISPVTANTRLCGTSAKPWSGGFTQTAFTVTSGEQTKTRPLEITDELLDAWSEVGFAQYQYVDRVIEKGDDGARWHFGFIAERAKEAFARHNLDAHRFAFFCYDEWEDQYIDVQINEGETIKQTVYLEQYVMVEGTDTPVTKRVFFVNEDGSPAIDEEGKPRYADEPVIETVEREIDVPAPPVYEKQLETPAGKRYGVRYEEALILECALQRRNYDQQQILNEKMLNRIMALEKDKNSLG